MHAIDSIKEKTNQNGRNADNDRDKKRLTADRVKIAGISELPHALINFLNF